MTPHIDAIKAAIGGTFALASWAGGQIAQAVELPDIVKAADTPLIVVGMGYGIFHLWRELRTERSARMTDQKTTNDARMADQCNFIAILREDARNAADTRDKLIKATTAQTEEFKALRRSIESRNRVDHV